MATVIATLRALFAGRIRTLERLGAGIPRIGRTAFGPVNIVLVNTPELVPEVLIDRAIDFQKGPVLRTLSRPLLGNGLLNSEGDEHLARRKLVAPAFAHQRVSRYANVIRDYAEAAQSGWRPGDRIDIAQAMMHLTLRIVGRTLFDVDLLSDAETLGRDITDLQVWLMRQRRMPFRIPFFRQPVAALARLNQTIYKLIRDRRGSGLDKGDLLSMLLLSRDEETGRALDDEQVRDEAMTLFVAGHETTAQAMAWSWYLLAQHPACFERLRAEGISYALQVMKEAMRLYPPAYIIARSALRDTSIGGFAIHKDELVLIAPWLIHRDRRNFDDPLRFDPDRFLPDREAALQRFAYMPFGGGRRICIGNQFALMEGQTILSTIARHMSMELTSSKAVGLQPLLTLRPKDGIHVRIRRI
jgi:cytochrome P450